MRTRSRFFSLILIILATAETSLAAKYFGYNLELLPQLASTTQCQATAANSTGSSILGICISIDYPYPYGVYWSGFGPTKTVNRLASGTPSNFVQPAAMNSAGQIIGYYQPFQGTNIYGFYMRTATDPRIVPMEAVSADSVACIPESININGEVVGYCTDALGNMSGFYWSQSAGVKAVKGLSECQYSNPTLISDTGTIYGVSYGCKNGTNSFFSKPNSGSAVSIWSECTVGAPSLWSAITFLGSGETMGGACNYAAVDDTGSSMIWPLGKQNTSHSYLVGTSSNGVMAGLADNGGPFILSNGTVTYFNKAQNFGGSFVSLESITPSGILVGSFCDSSLESCSGYLLTPSAK